MSMRIKRLWQPGNPQYRVFLPDFWVRVVESPICGPGRVPKNCVKFEVDKRMSRHDVREYLEKIYDLPVRDVRTLVKEEVEWYNVSVQKYRKAFWKEDERKFAYVFLKKGLEFDFPKLFEVVEDEESIKKMQESAKSMGSDEANRVNRYRKGTGSLFAL